MSEQTTIDRPLLVTLEGAELMLQGPNCEPVMNVQVMTYGAEEAKVLHFDLPLEEYVKLLQSNSLTGIPRNPNYPRFELLTTDGAVVSVEAIMNTADLELALKRTERAA